jgi:hypothetical protein
MQETALARRRSADRPMSESLQRWTSVGASVAFTVGAIAGVRWAANLAKKCRDSDVVDNHFISGLNNAEDLVFLEGTPWVITSNMGDRSWSHGGFFAVNVLNRDVVALNPDFSQPPAALFRDCGEPPDSVLFSSHGIDVRRVDTNRFSLLAVNHGGRESVEVFDVDTSGPVPTMTWCGGVLTPNELAADAVAWLGDEELLVTILGEKPTVGTFVNLLRGARLATYYGGRRHAAGLGYPAANPQLRTGWWCRPIAR